MKDISDIPLSPFDIRLLFRAIQPLLNDQALHLLQSLHGNNFLVSS